MDRADLMYSLEQIDPVSSSSQQVLLEFGGQLTGCTGHVEGQRGHAMM